ncbi:MAG TPA: hypothetical protein VIB00_08530 [Pyrinomonadaceae bacterium]|jgi:hypothetical protein
MKRLLMALALTCVFSVSALAGDVPTSDYVPPPPPPGQNRPTASQQVETLIQTRESNESDQASLDPWQSLMLAILSLLAR